MEYNANESRYENMPYRRCGKSGLKLPAISLGLWHNFGGQADYANSRQMLLDAFDGGITHFDIANNYGPPAGTAEETFGRVFKADLAPHRDEIIVSSKAGYYMWPGPYGEWGSRKNLFASIDQSLARTSLDYFDIFYHHRPDPETPLEETMRALADIVKSGKALYVGISNYNPQDTLAAVTMLKEMGVPCLIHQMSYSMLYRQNEEVISVLESEGVGSIAYSPLAQGVLTGKYINGIPEGSRAAGGSIFLTKERINPADVEKTRKLSEISKRRGQSLTQMALAWVLRQNGGTTSVIIGASRPGQIAENIKTVDNLDFTPAELAEIDAILAE